MHVLVFAGAESYYVRCLMSENGPKIVDGKLVVDELG